MANVQDWLDKTLTGSETMGNFMLAQELDDSLGFKSIFSMLWDQPPTERISGVLLTGPNGCGKHTAAAHILEFLGEKDFGFAFLDGWELCAQGMAGGSERLNKLLDHFYDQGKGLCILLENAERCTCRQELLSLLGHLLYEYWLNQEQLPPLFLVLIDQQEQDIPSILRRRIQRYRFGLPDRYARKVFLENNASDIKSFVPMDVFISQTEGATYAQLVDMIANLRHMVDYRDSGVPQEEFTSFLAAQMPEPKSQDVMKQLAQSAQQFVDQLPKLMQSMASIQGSVVVQSNTAPVQTAAPQTQSPELDPASFIASKNSEIQNMSVRQLGLELFGEDGVSSIMERCSQLQKSPSAALLNS